MGGRKGELGGGREDEDEDEDEDEGNQININLKAAFVEPHRKPFSPAIAGHCIMISFRAANK